MTPYGCKASLISPANTSISSPSLKVLLKYSLSTIEVPSTLSTYKELSYKYSFEPGKTPSIVIDP